MSATSVSLVIWIVDSRVWGFRKQRQTIAVEGKRTYGKKRLLIGKCPDVAVELSPSIWADNTI
jgi:hypothetical protein